MEVKGKTSFLLSATARSTEDMKVIMQRGAAEVGGGGLSQTPQAEITGALSISADGWALAVTLTRFITSLEACPQ